MNEETINGISDAEARDWVREHEPAPSRKGITSDPKRRDGVFVIPTARKKSFQPAAKESYSGIRGW